MPTAQQVKDFESKSGKSATVKGGKIVAAPTPKGVATKVPSGNDKPAAPKKTTENADTPVTNDTTTDTNPTPTTETTSK